MCLGHIVTSNNVKSCFFFTVKQTLTPHHQWCNCILPDPVHTHSALPDTPAHWSHSSSARLAVWASCENQTHYATHQRVNCYKHHRFLVKSCHFPENRHMLPTCTQADSWIGLPYKSIIIYNQQPIGIRHVIAQKSPQDGECFPTVTCK